MVRATHRAAATIPIPTPADARTTTVGKSTSKCPKSLDKFRPEYVDIIRPAQPQILHGHDGAFAIRHEHVVADPHLDLFPRDRVQHEEAGRHALLFHRGEVGLLHAAALAFVDEGREFGIPLRGLGRERRAAGEVRVAGVAVLRIAGDADHVILLVHRVQQRLAHLLVVERRVQEVEADHAHRAERIVVLHRDTLVLREQVSGIDPAIAFSDPQEITGRGQWVRFISFARRISEVSSLVSTSTTIRFVAIA